MLLAGCIGGSFKQDAYELGKSAAEGAIEAAKPALAKAADDAAAKLDEKIAARANEAQDKPADERSASDWLWIALAMGTGATGANGLRGVIRRFLGDPAKKA